MSGGSLGTGSNFAGSEKVCHSRRAPTAMRSIGTHPVACSAKSSIIEPYMKPLGRRRAGTTMVRRDGRMPYVGLLEPSYLADLFAPITLQSLVFSDGSGLSEIAEFHLSLL